MKRVSKDEWLQAAWKILDTQGVEAIRVERIAKELGISKSGFYWHFQDRNDLRNQMVDYWAHEFTQVVTANPLLEQTPPKERLEKIMIMILKHDIGRYEAPMLHWAKVDPQIASRVKKVYRERLAFIGQAFLELGFEGDELEMRTRMFVCYQAWERSTFWMDSKKSLHKLIRHRVDLLTKK